MRGKPVRLLAAMAVMAMILPLAGCDGGEDSTSGSLDRQAFTMSVYDNAGGLVMTSHARKIEMSDNMTDAGYYSGIGVSTDLSGTLSAGSVEEESAAITVTLDGREFDSCGDTLIFAEDGLEPVKGFDANAFKRDDTSDVAPMNRLRDSFDRKSIVVVKSQTGTPIEAFNGDKVEWGVCDDLPKTTKIQVDGKLLYIHRANFQIMDRGSLN